MTFIDSLGDFWWPGPIPNFLANPPAFSSLGTNNSANLRSAYILRAPLSGTLHSFEFCSGTYSGTNTPRISFQDVDLATGDPDGVVDQFRTVTGASNSWIAPSGPLTDDGTNGGVKRSISAGDLFACVLDYSAYTNGTFGMVALGRSATNRVMPYHTTYNGTVWTKSATLTYAGMALRYSSPAAYVHVPETYLATTINSTSFNSNSAADEYSAVFVMPFDCTIDGMWGYVDYDGDCQMVFYDNGGSPAATVTFDKDARQTTSTSFIETAFDPQTVSAGDTVRVAIKPTTTTSVTIQTRTIASGISAATFGGTTSGWQSTRVDSGSWGATSSTIKMFAGLHIAQFDDGAGSPPPPPPPPPPSGATRLVQGQVLAG